MDKDVYVGIDVSKTELVVAVRPSSESFTLAYHRAGLKQLVGRLGELKPKLVVVEATGGLQRQVVAALWTGGASGGSPKPRWGWRSPAGGAVLAQALPLRPPVAPPFAP